jgi:YopX protein
MKREIKFRAWNHIVGRMSNAYTIEELYKQKVNFTNIKLLQFIGLKDKKGNEVCDGDIILIDWNHGTQSYETISYDENYGYWKYGNNPICELIDDPVTPFEVIGNIYQP